MLREFYVTLRLFQGRLIVDAAYPDHSLYLVEDHPNWKDFYSDAEEEIPNDLPMSKGPKVRMAIYVDADHVHAIVTNKVRYRLPSDVQ
jgi:hypothetical protein